MNSNIEIGSELLLVRMTSINNTDLNIGRVSGLKSFKEASIDLKYRLLSAL